AAALRVLHAALDAGLTFIDTADSYCVDADEVGHSEGLIREALEVWPGDRDRVVVATKAGLVRPGGAWRPDGRPEHLRASCEASLRRLGVDALDLFQLHTVDPKVPFEESLGAMVRLLEEGKVKRLGLCNISVDQLEAARALTSIHAVQNLCSYLDKAALERGLALRCHELGITFIAHSPVGGHGGVERADRNKALVEVAKRHGATARQIALAWLLHMGPSIVPIPGATRTESVASTVGAAEIALGDDDLEILASNRRAFAREVRPRLWATAPAASEAADREVVLFIGPPAAGKSSRVAPYLDRGYQRLNRDAEGGRLDDLVPKMAAAIDQGQRAFVLDNTYPTVKSRKKVLELAQRHHLPVRCVWLDVPLAEALYNACLRMLERHGRILGPKELPRAAKDDPNMLPPAAIYRFFQLFEEPSQDEGFSTIERVAFERRVAADMTQKALVLDYDGSLRRSTGPAPFPLQPDDVEILPGRKEVLDRYVADGYLLLGVSNQSAIGKGQLTDAVARACFDRTHELLGHTIDVRYSPDPSSNMGVWSRKPMPGLGVDLIEHYRLDRAACIMVGDLESDREFARHCGFQYRDAADFFGG
ncbi:MAG: aldo/keto reductase, partial [Acidobacteriota bacterium]